MYNKTWKKQIAFLLIIAMMLTIMPMAVFAAEGETETVPVYEAVANDTATSVKTKLNEPFQLTAKLTTSSQITTVNVVWTPAGEGDTTVSETGNANEGYTYSSTCTFTMNSLPSTVTAVFENDGQPAGTATYEIALAKVITVAADGTGDYTTIQNAIDYVAEQNDSTGWTIEVKNGTYDRFTVPHWNASGIADLTVVGESEDGVVVNVLNEAYTESALIDNGGINIYGTNITLKNMTIKAGTVKQAWDDAAISTNHGMNGGANVSLTVDNCTLIGPGVGNGASYGVFWACSRVEVTNCNISGFANAIEYMNDSFNVPAGETFRFTGNTITGASFAFHGYMGGGNGGGTILFANNTVTGTDDLRSKVICQDNTTNSFVVDIRNNDLTNAIVGLVNLQNEGDVISDVLTSNTFGKNCFYVEAIEPGTIEFYTTYQAPANGLGQWVLTGLDDFDVDWGKNPDGSTAYIQDIANKANEEGAKTLSITGIDENNLIKTFTWFKDGIYWESIPGLEITKTVNCTVSDCEKEHSEELFEFAVEIKDNDGAVKESATMYNTKGEKVTWTGENIFLKDGQTVMFEMQMGDTYTVTEVDSKGYNCNQLEQSGEIEALENKVEFVNAHKPSGGGGGGSASTTLTKTIEKVWQGDISSDRPDSITVQILKNGEVYDTITLNAANGWDYTWTVINDGTEWSVQEVNVPEGYTSAMEEVSSGTFVITNTFDDGEEPPVTPQNPDEVIDDPDVPKGDAEVPGEPVNPEEPVVVPGEEIEEPEIPLGDAPKTGDTTEAVPFMALMMFALAGLVITRRRFN